MWYSCSTVGKHAARGQDNMDILERVTEGYVVLRQSIGQVRMAHRTQFTVADARLVLCSIAEAVHWEGLQARSTDESDALTCMQQARVYWAGAEAAIRESYRRMPPAEFHLS